MNNDLISREALKKKIEFFKSGHNSGTDYHDGIIDGYDFCIDAIDNAPTVEIGEDGIDIEKYSDRLYKIAYEKGKAEAERQHGKWRLTLTGDVICSVCKLPRRDARFNHIQFCNHCGAKMMGENTDT